MTRREFITAVAATALWPLQLRAQQSSLPVLGFLSTRGPDDSAHLTEAFRRGLAETGFVEGRNVRIEYRWARGNYERLPAMAAELLRIPVAMLVAIGGEPAARAAKAAAATVPIVTVFGADPVKNGLVASLSRPGGNMTGISNLSAALEPKRIGLLHELVPRAKAYGALLNPTSPTFADQAAEIQAAARTAGLDLHELRAATDRELETAFASAKQQNISALLAVADPFFNTRRAEVVALAARHGIPAMYSFRDYAVAGGLMSYGIDLPETYRQAGIYAGRVLKGEKPADLPISQPTKFEFVINLKTAKALGVKFSDNLLSLADEVIE